MELPAKSCILSPFLFLAAVDWIMKTGTGRRQNGFRWTLWGRLDDVDFADDVTLLQRNLKQIQEKTLPIKTTAATLGRNVNKG